MTWQLWLVAGLGIAAAVGLAGVIWLANHPVLERWIWVSFFVGVILTGLGSGYSEQRDCGWVLVALAR